MMNYNFEWSYQKAQSNVTKHGVSFEESATVFKDPMALSIYDDEHSINEERWLTLGISKAGKLLLVCHTFQKHSNATVSIRIFSCRKETKKESKQYGE